MPPAVITLVLGGFAAWGFLTASRSAASFAAHAVAATAVIEQIHLSPAQSSVNGLRFTEYGVIRYVAGGQRKRAEIVLAACVGQCFPVYHVGETLHVSYDSQNGYVTFPALRRGAGTDTSGFGVLAWVAALFGAFSLVVAVGRMGRQATAQVTP